MAFQDILKQISEEADRTQVAALAEKYPVIRQFVEQGEVLAGVRPDLDRMGMDVGRAVSYANGWREWEGQAWITPDTAPEELRPYVGKDGSTRQEAILRRERAEQALRIAELEQDRGTDMNLEEIKESLKREGYLPASEVASQVEAKVAERMKGVATAEQLTNMAVRFQDVFAELGPEIAEHRSKYGERLNVRGLFDLMIKDNIADPRKAYEAYVAPLEQKRQQEQFAAEKKAEREEGRKEGEQAARTALAAERGHPAMPLSGSHAPMGHMQRRALERAGKDQPSGRLGAGSIAAKHTQEFLQKQAGQVGQ